VDKLRKWYIHMDKAVKSKKIRKLLIWTFFIVINIIVLFVMGKKDFQGNPQIRFDEMFNIWMTHIPYLVIALLLPIVALLAEGLKYYFLILFSTKKKRLFVSLKTAVLGKYFDNLTPLGSGGQAFQIYYLYKKDVPSGIAGSLPIAGFSMMQLAFFLLSIVVFITNGVMIDSNAFKIAAYIGSVFAIFVPLVFLIYLLIPQLSEKIIQFALKIFHKMKLIKNPKKRLKKIHKFEADFKNSMSMLSSSPILIILTFLLSLIYQLALCSIPYFVVLASGGTASWFDVLTLTVFTYAAIAFIPTPGNSGAAEFSFALIFTMLSGGVIYWAMMFWRISSYYFVILIGLIFLLIQPENMDLKKSEIEEQEVNN